MKTGGSCRLYAPSYTLLTPIRFTSPVGLLVGIDDDRNLEIAANIMAYYGNTILFQFQSR